MMLPRVGQTGKNKKRRENGKRKPEVKKGYACRLKEQLRGANPAAAAVALRRAVTDNTAEKIKNGDR